MRLPLIVVGLVLCAVLRAGSAEPRAGKVVRIERHGRGKSIAPQMCVELRGSGDQASAICLGAEPKVGMVIEGIDDTHVFGAMRISEVERAVQNCDGLWTVKGSVTAGDLASAASGRALGLIDGGLDRRAAHRLPDDIVRAPGGGSDDRVAAVIDRDGTGQQLLVVTQYTCDSQGTATSQGTIGCMDFWMGPATGRMSRVSQTIGCQF